MYIGVRHTYHLYMDQKRRLIPPLIAPALKTKCLKVLDILYIVYNRFMGVTYYHCDIKKRMEVLLLLRKLSFKKAEYKAKLRDIMTLYSYKNLGKNKLYIYNELSQKIGLNM